MHTRTMIASLMTVAVSLFASSCGNGLRTPPASWSGHDAVIDEVEEWLASREHAHFELGEVTKHEYGVNIELLFTDKRYQQRQQQLIALVHHVSMEAGVPGRVAGWVMDQEDLDMVVGDVVEFGYSKELGYDAPTLRTSEPLE